MSLMVACSAINLIHKWFAVRPVETFGPLINISPQHINSFSLVLGSEIIDSLRVWVVCTMIVRVFAIPVLLVYLIQASDSAVYSASNQPKYSNIEALTFGTWTLLNGGR
jgi:hypothetical protein